MDGIVHATFVDLKEEDSLSPDTSEFVHLERQIMDPPSIQFERHSDPLLPQPTNFIIGGEHPPLPPPPPPLVQINPTLTPPTIGLTHAASTSSVSSSSGCSTSFRKTSEEVQKELELEEQHRQLLQSELEEKLEERKRSMELSSTENGLQLMERRQFRQFSRADEYLYAMKEDLAEWMNNLYPLIDMDADNFMNRLETGEHLVQVGKNSAFIYVFESTMGLFVPWL